MNPVPRVARDLSAPKRELLALLLEQESKALSPLNVSHSPEADVTALSFSQERLWFLAQLDPGLPSYNFARSWRLGGRLDALALEKSFATLLARHESLRATFSCVDGRPEQHVLPPEPFRLPIVDLTGLHDEAKEAEALRLAAEAATQPFDLGHGALFRISLVRLSDTDHILRFTTHHLVFDGWSAGIVVRELGALYDRFSAGLAPNLADVSIRYADFIYWQRERFSGERAAALCAYWKQQLDGVPELLLLPTDRPRPAKPNSRGARHAVAMPLGLIDDLKALSRRHGVTPFMTLLAAFQTLLHRYTGENDIVVGSAIANRTSIELGGLVGRFANTLPLRAKLQGDPLFSELLACVKETALGAYAHQDMPFEKLVEALRPRRTLSHSPVVQVAFGLQSASTLSLSALTVVPLDVHNGHAKFDLTLTVVESAGGMTASYEYRTDLFDAQTIRRMAGHFHTLLEAIVRSPEQRLSALPLVGEREGDQVVLARYRADGNSVGLGRLDEAVPLRAQTVRDLPESLGPPRDSLELKLAGIWQQILGRPIGVNDDFFELGGHSLLAVLLVARIGKLCGVTLTPAVLLEAPTVRQLANLLRGNAKLPPWSTVVAIHATGALPPLFCIHAAGGNVLGYADLARHLGPDQPVYGVQAPGLESNRAPLTNLEAIAEHYVNEIRKLQPRGPYYLCGLSFGGVVAFEMARHLHEQGQQIGLLALFDTGRPGHSRSLAPGLQLVNYARRARYHVGQLLWGPDRRDYLARKYRTAKRRIRESTWRLLYLSYKASGRELPRILQQLRAAHRAALRAYRPRPFPGRVTLFLASERPIDLHRADDLGWAAYAPGGVEIHNVAGDHVSLIVEPAVGVLAEQLRDCLARARRSFSGQARTETAAVPAAEGSPELMTTQEGT